MDFIYYSNIIESDNIKISSVAPIVENKFYSGIKDLVYPSLVKIDGNQFMYIRVYNEYKDKEKKKEQHIRYKIENMTNFIKDDNYLLHLGKASHNLYMFNAEDKKVYGIGGQHCSPKFENYEEEVNKNTIILPGIFLYGYNEVFNHYKPNKYYANGLHLFEYNDNNLYVVNDKLPVISGIHPGRNDRHYGPYVEGTEGIGLTVFDSITSIVFNHTINKYFLFQRANIGLGIRGIQYTTSNDLKNWSEFKLCNFNNVNVNGFYSPNMFKLSNINSYICIIPYNKLKNSNTSDENGSFLIYFSKDLHNWYYIDKFCDHKLDETFITNPLEYEDKYYIYKTDIHGYIYCYSLPKYRISYVESLRSDLQSTMTINYEQEGSIYINCKVENLGYIKIIINYKDKTTKVVDDIIGPIDNTIQLTTNNIPIMLNNVECITIKFFKSNIYLIGTLA